MKCPICGAETKMIQTRSRGEYIYRQRKCGAGHRFSTHETVVKKLPQISTARYDLPFAPIALKIPHKVQNT